MPSAVDLCNEALSHLGDSATVSSIDPPEGSAQAGHCARFYPTALNALLEMHLWAFATKRATLAEVTNPSTTWEHAYAAPNLVVNYISVLAPDAPDDYSSSVTTTNTNSYDRTTAYGNYTPQAFVTETTAAGDEIILTNQADAVLRYTQLVTDPTKFSPLFCEALGWFLASKLAGPIVKGSEGRKAATDCMKMFTYWFNKATDSDASQRKVTPQHQVTWMNVR